MAISSPYYSKGKILRGIFIETMRVNLDEIENSVFGAFQAEFTMYFSCIKGGPDKIRESLSIPEKSGGVTCGEASPACHPRRAFLHPQSKPALSSRSRPCIVHIHTTKRD